MKGAHSAKKMAKPKKTDKAKKKKSGASGVALKVDPDIIRSTLAAKPVQDEKEQSAKKASRSSHSAKRKSKTESRDKDGKKGSRALVVCIIIVAIVLIGLAIALATHTIDLSKGSSASDASREQPEEELEPTEEPSPSSNTQEEPFSGASPHDDLIEDGSYHNSRFGFSVEVPEGFHIDSLIDNGDGVILSNDALDMSVRVTGANNLEGQSAQDILNSVWKQGDDSIGQADGNRVIVYQYDELSEYFYWIYVGTGSINQMVIEYPVHDANDTELKVAQELMRGFTPGRINRQH